MISDQTIVSNRISNKFTWNISRLSLFLKKWKRLKSINRKELLTASKLMPSVRALATPFGISGMLDGASIVSCLAALTWFAAELVAAPFCGFVASRSTFREAMACSCVAFSSTLPKTLPKRAQLILKTGKVFRP